MPGGFRSVASAVRAAGSAMASCSSGALLESMRDLASAWLVLCSSSFVLRARMCCNIGAIASAREDRFPLKLMSKIAGKLTVKVLLAEVFKNLAVKISGALGAHCSA